MLRRPKFASAIAVLLALVFTIGQTLPVALAAPLDTVPPVIQVGGVSDGAIYDAFVSPTVTSDDPDLATLQVTLDGAAWVSGSEVGVGRHTLAALATDTSGNPSAISIFFIVDTVSPVLWSFSPVPANVNVGFSHQDVVYRIELSDDFAGIDMVASGVELRSANGIFAEVVTPLVLVAGDPLSGKGSFTQTLRIPMNSEAGVWVPRAIFYDLAGHAHTVDTSDLLGFGGDKRVYVSNTTVPVDRVDAAIVVAAPVAVAAGTSVSFTAAANDLLGHAISTYEWSSSIGGVLGTSSGPTFATTGLPVGTNRISVRARCVDGTWSVPAQYGTAVVVRPAQTDFVAPATSSDAAASYLESAVITLVAYDLYGTGVAHTYYVLDDGATAEGTSVTTSATGTHTLRFWSVDRAGNVEAATVRTFVVAPLPVPAVVGKPAAPTSARRGAGFTVSGFVSPAHVSGTYLVTLYCYRYQSGHYVLRKTVMARRYEYSDTQSRYSARVTLPYTGRWRIRAYHADAEHTPTYSSYRYVTIR